MTASACGVVERDVWMNGVSVLVRCREADGDGLVKRWFML